MNLSALGNLPTTWAMLLTRSQISMPRFQIGLRRLPHRVPRLEGGVLLGPSLQSLGLPSEVPTLSARALLAQFSL